MDGLCLFSPPPAVSFQVGAQRAHRSHPPNLSYSAKSLRSKSSSESSVCGLSKSTGLVTGQPKIAKISGSPEQKGFILNGSSDLVHNASNATSSADCVKDTMKADNPAKRSSRKKGKRKGKQLKKLSCTNNSSGLENFSEVGVHVNSVSGTSANIDPPWGGGPITQHSLIENDMEPMAPSQEIFLDRNDAKENGYGVKHSATHRTLTSYSSSVDKPEAVVPCGPQNIIGDDIVFSSTNGVHPTDQVLSFKREVVDIHMKQPSYCKNTSFKVFTDVHRSPSLGSVSDGWNSDDCTSAGDCTDEKSSNKEDNLSQSSEYIHRITSFSGPGKRYLLHGIFSHGVDDDDDKNAERAKSGNLGCRNCGLHSVVSGKRGEQDGELPGSSVGVLRLSSGRNVHGRTGKENNHSVWQKVQKDNANKFIREPVNATPILTHKGVSYVDSSDLLKSNDENNKLAGKVSEKLKRKPTGSKQDNNNSYRKGPHSSKTNVVRHKKSNMQQKEASEIPPYQVNPHKSFRSGLVDYQRVELGQTESVKGSPTESIRNSLAFLDDIKPLGSGSTRFLKNVQAAPNQNSTSSKSSALLDPKHVLEEHFCGYLHLPVSRPSKLEAKVSYPENGKQEHTSGSVMKKWVPVLRKDAEVTGTTISDNLLTLPVDESFESRWTVKRTENKEISSQSHCSESSTNTRDAFIGSSSSNINHPPTKDDDQTDSLRCKYNNTSRSEDNCITSTAANRLLTQESQAHYGSVSETDSNKIGKAVSDAYRVQLTSEGVQMVTRCPLAEFERLLHSASPVLGQTQCVGHCQSCSRDQPTLCRHEIPNVSLGSLWRWYEKHGSYGLEVKAEDYQNFKRLGTDNFEFRAYFVPFLSAVQLFGNSSSHSVDTSNSISSVEGLNACNTNKETKYSSNIEHLPILSALLPQSKEELRTSESSPSSGQDEASNNSLVTERTYAELLFEYFESEQPQQRRPLFEKIEELVRGGPSSGRAYGDSTKLDSLDLRDLHPSSWYSVAWYPIYRIPDGNFRAAFLTYHSLGHLVNRSTPSDPTGENTCIVSPVVGLQSYNTQEERWLQLKHLATVNAEEETSGGFNRSEILKERLRTLQAAASVMARTVVNRGDVGFVNRQPDYEFFLSRQRW